MDAERQAHITRILEARRARGVDQQPKLSGLDTVHQAHMTRILEARRARGDQGS